MWERYRNSLWALRLKQSGLSWDELDAMLLGASSDGAASDPEDPNGTLLRVIHRIFKRGDRPNGVCLGNKRADSIGRRGEAKIKRLQPPVDLVAIASERLGAFGQRARADFDSPLWLLLSDPRSQGRSQVRTFCDEAAERTGFAAIDPEIADLLAMATQRPLANQGDLAAIRVAADDVARLGSLDALLILGGQARLALDRFAFEELGAYIDAIRLATNCLAEDLAEDFIPSGIESLIYQRLILRDWQEPDPRLWGRAKLSRDGASRGDPYQQGGRLHWLWWLENNPYGRLRSRRLEGFPITQTDPVIRWLHNSEQSLRKIAMLGLLGGGESHPDIVLTPEEQEILRNVMMIKATDSEI